MNSPDQAARHLEIIRALMERATIYRAISLPTALVGGTLSLVAFSLVWLFSNQEHQLPTALEFLGVWLVVLLLTTLASLLFLWRQAQRRSEPFFSSGMKLASLSLAPAFIAAGLFTWASRDPHQLAIAWILFYGIGLLSTQHFAPHSLVLLGLAFFITGGALLAFDISGFSFFGHSALSTVAMSALMAATFGGFHLLYALLVWVRGEDPAEASTPTSEASHV